MEKKTCQFCQQNIVGRNDKKFCDDQCRSAFNNHLNSKLNGKIKQVNAVLKNNRKILEHIYLNQEEKKQPIYKRKIQELGFIFNFHTHITEIEEGKTCICCYDYGYIPVKQGELAVIKMK